MKVEIYNNGKLLQDIDKGEIHVLTKYIASANEKKFRTEEKLTLGIGPESYWNCIVKMDIDEAKKLTATLEKLIPMFGKKDQVFEVIK